MKHFSPGLSDSIASVIADPAVCSHCDSSSSIGGGLCVGCLLQAGLAADEECAPETLVSALAEITLPDKNWRLGNYEILEEIGRGGMGVIYRARQRHSRRIVAVKRVLGYHADSRETLARFRREAQAAASLDHSNILPIYEVSESEDGLPFFSMKFAPGGNLQEVGPTLRNDPRQCVALVAKIARAVQHAHGKGILHRDLKPGNILLDAHGEPLVSDFGLAKWLDTTSDLTRTLTIFGTPGYIAPEQASGPAAQLKPAADIYSLGAILFDLLAGRPPFLGSHALSVIRQASETCAPKLRSLSKVADRDLETICARCLERAPTARYRSAHDLATDLERWLGGRPIIARPVSSPMRIWRWSRRNPRLAGSLAACVLLGATALTWQVRSHHLAGAVRESQIKAHSVAVIPFLDLDSVQPDFEFSRSVSTSLGLGLAAIGESKTAFVSALPVQWTGTGTTDEIRAAARDGDCRLVLTGTVRRAQEFVRVSLQLARENGSDVLGCWMIEEPLIQRDLAALVAHRIAREIYDAAGLSRGTTSVSQPDPGWQSEPARAYLNTGRLLLDRRTIPDTDRAIASFEAAVRAEPRSVEARSYLAMACIGRNFIGSEPKLVERAMQVAREAIELAPANPIAHRGLCAVYTYTGLYEQALEHGLRALECGDRSERAFGQIAFIWKQLGRPDNAITWFRKAKVSPTQPADYEALMGDCWTLLGEDEKAARSYDEAIRFRPDLPEGWLGLIQLKLVRGEIQEARALYNEKAAEFAAFPVAQQLHAQIEFFGRNFPEAERLYAQLYRVDPQGGGVQQYGGLSYQSALARLEKERTKTAKASSFISESLAHNRSALEKSPRNPEILYRLAADEAVAANHVAALKHFSESIACGWIDYRSPGLDPRFDTLSQNPQFSYLLDDLATRVADLRRQKPADVLASTQTKE